jgi:predicted TIM-barrel fold metal-dependent hydrolase
VTTSTIQPMSPTDHYTLISADTHAGGSHEQYREYLDPAYRDEFDAWRNRYKNPFKDLHGHLRTRNWDDERRFSELEDDGVVGEVIFPNTVPPFFPTGAVIARPPTPEQYELRLAGIRAHNRWLADFCAVAPERRAGVGQIFLNDIDDAVADVHWIAEHGLRGGVLLPGRPDDSTHIPPLYDPVLDPVWRACEELDLPVTHHSGQGAPDYGKHPFTMTLWIAETSWFSHRPLTHLIVGGVFERFPDLTFVMTEQGCAWIPSVLQMLDGFHAQMASGRIGEIKYAEDAMLSMKPSDYFARNCYVGVSFPNPTEARAMRIVGLDRVMWGSDYPHDESTYPYTTAGLRRAFAEWDPAEVRQVVTDNCAAVYGFDPTVLDPIADRVGPTVEQVAQPLDAVPDGHNSPAFTRS